MLPHEWPHPSIQTRACRDYLSVVLTSKDLHDEASDYFERFCLPRSIIYFDNVPDLSDFSKAIAQSRPRYAEIQFSLRSRCCAAELPDVAHGVRQSDIWDLMRKQSDFESGHASILHVGLMPVDVQGVGWVKCNNGDLCQRLARGEVIIHKVHLDKLKNVQVTVTQIQRPTFLSAYAEMRGVISRLQWDGYTTDCSLERRLRYIQAPREQ